MGQKIHPTGFRLAVTRDWGSRWFANSKDFAGMLHEDLKVRDYLKKRLAHASVARVLIERPAKNARITLFSARPGVVIGKKGEDIEALKRDLQKIVGVPVHVNIEEVRKPELDAKLIADSSTLRMIFAPFLGEKARVSSARPTGMPRTRSATRRPFWADSRTPRRIALVSMSSP